MDCKQPKNIQKCVCSFQHCSRKGICCECIAYHLANRELPGCAFPSSAEATFDRSFEHFAQLVNNGKV